MKKKIVLFMSTLFAIFLALFAFSVDTYGRIEQIAHGDTGGGSIETDHNVSLTSSTTSLGDSNYGICDGYVYDVREYYSNYCSKENFIMEDEPFQQDTASQPGYAKYNKGCCNIAIVQDLGSGLASSLKSRNFQTNDGNNHYWEEIVYMFGNDPITAFVEKECFLSPGDYMMVGDEYGYYVHTVAREENITTTGTDTKTLPYFFSVVLLIDFAFTNDFENETCNFTANVISQTAYVTLDYQLYKSNVWDYGHYFETKVPKEDLDGERSVNYYCGYSDKPDDGYIVCPVVDNEKICTYDHLYVTNLHLEGEFFDTNYDSKANGLFKELNANIRANALQFSTETSLMDAITETISEEFEDFFKNMTADDVREIICLALRGTQAGAIAEAIDTAMDDIEMVINVLEKIVFKTIEKSQKQALFGDSTVNNQKDLTHKGGIVTNNFIYNLNEILNYDYDCFKNEWFFKDTAGLALLGQCEEDSKGHNLNDYVSYEINYNTNNLENTNRSLFFDYKFSMTPMYKEYYQNAYEKKHGIEVFLLPTISNFTRLSEIFQGHTTHYEFIVPEEVKRITNSKGIAGGMEKVYDLTRTDIYSESTRTQSHEVVLNTPQIPNKSMYSDSKVLYYYDATSKSSPFLFYFTYPYKYDVDLSYRIWDYDTKELAILVESGNVVDYVGLKPKARYMIEISYKPKCITSYISTENFENEIDNCNYAISSIFSNNDYFGISEDYVSELKSYTIDKKIDEIAHQIYEIGNLLAGSYYCGYDPLYVADLRSERDHLASMKEMYKEILVKLQEKEMLMSEKTRTEKYNIAMTLNSFSKKK